MYYKNLKILFKNYGRNFRIFHNSFVWKFSREEYKLFEYFWVFLNISEKCSSSYKNYKKNFYEGLKSFDILTISLSVLHNYFNSPIKFIFISVSKFLNTLAKSFFPLIEHKHTQN